LIDNLLSDSSLATLFKHLGLSQKEQDGLSTIMLIKNDIGIKTIDELGK